MFYCFLKKIIDFLYPNLCVVCKDEIQPLPIQRLGFCHSCFQKIKNNSCPVCNKCGVALEFDTIVCYRCDQNQDKFSYDQIRYPIYYSDPIKDLILRYKYSDDTKLSSLFIDQIFSFIPQNDKFFQDIDIVTCVPLHFFRLIKRKYNQAAILSNDIAKEVNKIHIPDLLKRVKNTKPQNMKEKKVRFKNLENAFSINKRYEMYVIEKNILIVDDVITSGATMHFCSLNLKKHGAKKVKGLCLAGLIRK